MNYYVMVGTLLLFTLVAIWIGKKTSDENQSSDDYFLSGRNIKFYNLTLTFLATQLGGGAILGSAEAAQTYGWHAIYYALGLSLGLIVLSLGVGKTLRKMNVKTIPEIFELKYNSPILKKITSLLMIVSFFLILVATGVAARKYFASIHITSPYIFILIWLTFLVYTVMGGLNAIVKTDKVQVSFILFVFIIVTIWMTMNMTEGIDLPSFEVLPTGNQDIPWTSWLLMPFIFALIGQDMGQRCFAGKSPKIVSLATASAGILLAISALLPTYLGIISTILNIDTSQGQSILMQTIIYLTNPTIAALFASAILLAIMSTADSLLCAISANVALDFNEFFRGKRDASLTLPKVITFVIGVLALLASFWSGDIIPIMVSAYELSVLTLFIPIIGAVLIPNATSKAAWGAIISGSLGFVLLKTTHNIPWIEVYIIGINAIIYLAIQIYTDQE